MIKYEVIGSNNVEAPIKTIATNRGIQDFHKLINIDNYPEHEVTYSYKLLDNILTAVEATCQLIEQAKTEPKVALIIVDSDTDGYTSSAMLYNYLKVISGKDSKLEIRYHVHANKTSKTHGVFNKDIDDDVDMVYVPDAGSHSEREICKIAKRGKQVIVLDHHIPTPNTNICEYAIVVNNQMCDYPNKELSGVGIVYKFCKALDEALNIDIANRYLDLVSLGMIADVMDTTQYETRYYMKRGMNNIKNDFLVALIDKQSYSMKGQVNFKTISWFIAPLINGAIRYGTLEERQNLFEAFIDNNPKTLPYKKRGTTESVDQPIAIAMARICANIKGRQDRARNKIVENLSQQVEDKALTDNKVLVVDGTDELKGEKSSLTGLIAMQLSSKYKQPTLLLRQYTAKDGQVIYGGSGRNFRHSPINSLQQLLLSTQCFDFVQGHDNAFGHRIKQSKLNEMIDLCNTKLSDIEFVPQYTVDFEILDIQQLTQQFVLSIGELVNEWGHGLEEPYIALKEIPVQYENISIIGKKQDTVKIQIDDVEIIKFKVTPEEVENIQNMRSKVGITHICLTGVGQAGINEWAGRITPQIILSDWKLESTVEYIF